MVKLFLRISTYVITIHQRHRQTDGQTVRRHAIAIPRFALKCIAQSKQPIGFGVIIPNRLSCKSDENCDFTEVLTLYWHTCTHSLRSAGRGRTVCPIQFMALDRSIIKNLSKSHLLLVISKNIQAWWHVRKYSSCVYEWFGRTSKHP